MPLSRIVKIIKRYMVHSLLGTIIASSFLVIIRDSDAFSSYPARIETLFIAFLALTLSPVKAVDRFSAVLSASARSFPWRNICYSNS
jgi:hypothetical protein